MNIAHFAAMGDFRYTTSGPPRTPYRPADRVENERGRGLARGKNSVDARNGGYATLLPRVAYHRHLDCHHAVAITIMD